MRVITCGGADQDDAARGEGIGDPLADGDDVLDLSGAEERCPAGGAASAPHVEGDGPVSPFGEPGGDPPEEALEASKDGVGVHEDDDEVADGGVRRLKEPRVQRDAVAGLDRHRLHPTTTASAGERGLFPPAVDFYY